MGKNKNKNTAPQETVVENLETTSNESVIAPEETPEVLTEEVLTETIIEETQSDEVIVPEETPEVPSEEVPSEEVIVPEETPEVPSEEVPKAGKKSKKETKVEEVEEEVLLPATETISVKYLIGKIRIFCGVKTFEAIKTDITATDCKITTIDVMTDSAVNVPALRRFVSEKGLDIGVR